MFDLLHEVKDFYMSECDKKKISLEFQIDLSPPVIMTDRRLVFTVLRNLISNEIKFSQAGGKVYIKVYKLPNGNNEISVAGTGICIPHKLQPMLFSINDHKTRQGTSNEKSTGLGLVIISDTLKLLGGHIRVQSDEGKGAEFNVSLPFAPESN